MNTRTILVLTFCVMAATSAGPGCGGNDLVVGGMLLPRPTISTTPTPTSCKASGGTCAEDDDCCDDLICNLNICQ